MAANLDKKREQAKDDTFTSYISKKLDFFPMVLAVCCQKRS